MKKILLSLSLLFFTGIAFSQTAFTGKVTHKFTTEKAGEGGTIEIFYGDQKIRGVKRVIQDKNVDNDDLLIDFSKAVIYHVNTVKKTYTVDSIKSRSEGGFPVLINEPSKNTMLLDRHCSAFVINDTDKTGFLDNMDFLFWYADSLYFPVNEKYPISDEIALFTNGKNIGMGIAITMKEGGKNKLFNLTPTSITAMTVPDSIFEIPNDYVLENNENTEPKMDSVMITQLDTTVKVPSVPKKPVKKKIPVKPSGSKTTTKPKVAARKEQ